MAKGLPSIEDLEALIAVDGVSEVNIKALPTIDSEELSNSYEDWKPEDTRIIVCAIANDIYSGVRYESREEAHRAITRQYGRILEANYVPGRAFFRIHKSTGRIRNVSSGGDTRDE